MKTLRYAFRFVFSLALLATGFHSHSALADAMNSGWAWTLSCPIYDQTGSSGTMTATNVDGFTCNGGCGTCQRLANNHFQSITFSGETLPGGATLNAATLYTLNIGKFFFVPPVISSDNNPLFTVNSVCNNFTVTANWLYIQIDRGNFATIKTYLLGTSTLSSASISDNANYDITGALTWSGSSVLPISSCSGGVYSISGNSDFDAKMYTGNDWSGLYKTGMGRATIFLPQNAITQSYLGSVTYTGVVYNSGTPGSVQNVRVTSNAAGSVFTITPYTNVSTNTLSGTTHDTITISAVNSPFNGAMKGTATRNGAGSGRVMCLANLGGGLDGQIIACSGEDPIDNGAPYAVVFASKPPPGTLDSLFNGNGEVITQVSTWAGAGGPQSAATAAVVDSSGKIYAAGFAYDTGQKYNFAIARYNWDGSLDTTFNSSGSIPGTELTQVSTAATPNSNGDGMALDSSGKPVVAGYAYDSSNHSAFGVVRYNTDGSLDTTFNTTGKAVVQPSNFSTPYAFPHSMTIDGSGRIILFGEAKDASGKTNFAVARFKSDGTLDTTFNSTGMELTQVSTYSTPYSQGHSVAVDSSDKIVGVGYAYDAGHHYNIAVVRYNTDGTLDTTFNSTGMELTQLSTYATSPQSSANDVIIDDAGKIVCGSNAYDTLGNYNFGVVRYNTDGTLDTTLNSTGKVMTQVSPYTNPQSEGYAIAIDSLGRIVLGGYLNDSSGHIAYGVARYNSDGSLDTTFNSTGKLVVQLSTYSTPLSEVFSPHAMAIYTDGRIVATGELKDASGHYNFGTLRIIP